MIALVVIPRYNVPMVAEDEPVDKPRPHYKNGLNVKAGHQVLPWPDWRQKEQFYFAVCIVTKIEQICVKVTWGD